MGYGHLGEDPRPAERVSDLVLGVMREHERLITIHHRRIEGLMHLALGAAIVSMTAVVLCMAIIVGLL